MRHSFSFLLYFTLCKVLQGNGSRGRLVYVVVLELGLGTFPRNPDAMPRAQERDKRHRAAEALTMHKKNLLRDRTISPELSS